MKTLTTSTFSTGFRRRIWDINSSYHCAIIGTCLRRAELRKLAGRKIFGLDARDGDYQLHSALVTQAGLNSPQAKALHTLLDGKYQAAINRYRRLKTDEAFETLWAMDRARGAIAGPFWAIMTSLAVSPELTQRIYSQIHMLGHDVVSDHQQQLRRLHELQDKCHIMQEMMAAERRLHLQQQRKLEEEVATWRLTQKQAAVIVQQHEHRLKANITLQNTNLPADTQAENNRLQSRISSLHQDSAIQCGNLDALAGELRQAHAVISDLKRTNSSLTDAISEQQQELLSLETALISKNIIGCAGCNDQATERCPGSELCGKKVLYVGGLKKMVPHYQQLVENYGGRFMHHDGGVEISRNQLPKMLGAADIVFCPVDCVSHDACLRVKKMCKHYHKPFVMMRSSGLSTLAKELGNITQ